MVLHIYTIIRVWYDCPRFTEGLHKVFSDILVIVSHEMLHVPNPHNVGQRVSGISYHYITVQVVRSKVIRAELVHPPCNKSQLLRDGPFDIQGGGAGIFPRNELFFSLFLHNKLFFSKVYCNKIFIFFGKNTLKSEKCK